MNVTLPFLPPPPTLCSMDSIGVSISRMMPHLPARRSLICQSRRQFCHILTNTKFKHVTSTYYHTWYLVFRFTYNVTYIIFSVCVCIFVYRTLNILFSVVVAHCPPNHTIIVNATLLVKILTWQDV